MEIMSPLWDIACTNLYFSHQFIGPYGVPGFLGDHSKLLGGAISHLGHVLHLHSLNVVLVIHHFLSQGFLNFLVDLVHDCGKVVVKFQLQLLVVTPALIRSPPFENLRQSEKDLAPTTLLLCEEIAVVAPHEAVVDVVLGRRPAPRWISLLVHLQAQFFDLVVLGLKAFFIWIYFSSRRR